MKLNDIDDVDKYLDTLLEGKTPPFDIELEGARRVAWTVSDANGVEVYSVACDVDDPDRWRLAQAMADMLNALVIQRAWIEQRLSQDDDSHGD